MQLNVSKNDYSSWSFVNRTITSKKKIQITTKDTFQPMVSHPILYLNPYNISYHFFSVTDNIMPKIINPTANACLYDIVALKTRHVINKTVTILPPAKRAVFNEILGEIGRPL